MLEYIKILPKGNCATYLFENIAYDKWNSPNTNYENLYLHREFTAFAFVNLLQNILQNMPRCHAK